MVVITEIEDRRISKPYLGGYRNKLTKIEYLHAWSQTDPRRVVKKDAHTRDVQCVEVSHVTCQTVRHSSTQTARKDLYIPSSTDVHITPKHYEDAEERAKRLDLDGHARRIQKFYRAYRLLKYIKKWARQYRNKVEECRKLEAERARTLRKRHEQEIIRQTFPRVRGDFDKLFSLIDRWRISCFEKASKNLFTGSRKAESCRVLEKTTDMLKSLEQQRLLTSLERRENERLRFLTFHCKPIQWHGYKAKKVEMITLRVQKAREYKKLYDNLMADYDTVEERIALLILLRNSFKNHSCIVVENLINLLYQEMALLSSGVESKWLNNLRQRISVAYLNVVKEMGRCTCVVDDDSLSQEIMSVPRSTRKLLCKGCLKMLPCESFSAHVRMKKLSFCLNCSWLRQQNIDKADYGPYTFLLNGIRADEQRRNCYSSLLYVIREPGIYHLVNNIWHGHSIVSENDDIFDLRLVRFNIEEEWSPWNCILLTSEEAETHYFVKDFESFYSKRLLHKIYLAHQIAKTHFEDLIRFEEKFRLSGRYYMIQDRHDYVPFVPEI